jgi:RNA polymerase sigma-70 factor (ECF subfamily)
VGAFAVLSALMTAAIDVYEVHESPNPCFRLRPRGQKRKPVAVMTADGGGMVGTVLRPIEGGVLIAQYMIAIADKAPGLELLERSVNGVPGLVAHHAGVVMTVASFDVADGRVTRIWAVRNPEKLRPWAQES